MTLGQKIKELRIKSGITQKGLAEKLNVSFQTVSKWENDENEPDIATLKMLSSTFECSIDYLLDNSNMPIANVEGINVDKTKEEQKPVTQTIIIQQSPLHVCDICHKEIPEDQLRQQTVVDRPGHRERPATYKTVYYHKDCLSKQISEERHKAQVARQWQADLQKRRSFGWGIAGGIVALAISLIVMLKNETCKNAIHPALAVLYSALIGYAIFAMLYCIISGSYIAYIFFGCAHFSIKFPGIIFTFDLDGIAFLIGMKILFAVIAFLVGVAALAFATLLSAALGGISFPFVLIHNQNGGYEDNIWTERPFD